MWVFKVDGEEVVPAGCSNQRNGQRFSSINHIMHFQTSPAKVFLFNVLKTAVPITLTPRYGHLFGGTAVIVTGPCFSSSDTVHCDFGGVRAIGRFISEDQYLCITPLLNEIGETDFILTVESQSPGETTTFRSKFLTGKSYVPYLPVYSPPYFVCAFHS